MGGDERQNLTALIQASRQGEAGARDRLFTIVYDELRSMAQHAWHVGRYGDTMQPTALANEAYLFFEKHFPVPPKEEPENRETFFRTIALAMRAILKDYWRSKKAAKRGGGERPRHLSSVDVPEPAENEFSDVDFLELDEALHRLEGRNGRWFSVVMHRYFGGRSIEETAELLNISPATVKSDWQLARAWLRRKLGAEGEP